MSKTADKNIGGQRLVFFGGIIYNLPYFYVQFDNLLTGIESHTVEWGYHRPKCLKHLKKVSGKFKIELPFRSVLFYDGFSGSLVLHELNLSWQLHRSYIELGIELISQVKSG